MPERPPPGSTRLDELDRKDAWRLLNGLVLERHRGRLEAIPEVTSVGAGIRETGGRLPDARPLCLKVLVHRKGEPVAERPVPRWVTVTTEEHGTVAVPTDVEPVGEITPQESSRVRSPRIAGAGAGSCCGVWSDGDGRRFVLSAAHVLACPKPEEQVRWTKRGVSDGGGTLQGLPGWYWRTREADRRLTYLDVALVEIDEDGAFQRPGLYPSADRRITWEERDDHRRVTICGQRTQHSAEWTSTGEPGAVHVSTRGGQLPYWRVSFYRLEGGETEAGDSGAAVISTTGRLVGMHLGMRTVHQTGRRYAIVLCSGDILDSYRELMPGFRLGG